MTPRELFERVKQHLLTQKARAMDDKGEECRYRAANGLKCAIGILIPDENYSEDLEGCSVPSAGYLAGLKEDDKQVRLVKAAGLTPKLLHIATRLQYCHDRVAVEMWPQYLDLIEKQELEFYGL